MLLKRDGFALLQVMSVLTVCLAVFAFVLPNVLNSSKGANSSASKTRLTNALTSSRFALAETGACSARIVPGAGFSLALVAPPPPIGTNEIAILDPNNPAANLVKGIKFSTPAPLDYTKYSDLDILSVQLIVTDVFPDKADRQVLGTNVANETPVDPIPVETEARYLAMIKITGQRKNNGGFSNYLGASTITAQFPIIVQANGAVIDMCSSRSVYLGKIGTTPKSALECIDRDGSPVQIQNTTVCQVPYAGMATVMFPYNCQAANIPSSTLNPSGSPLSYENWSVFTGSPAVTPPAGFAYCI